MLSSFAPSSPELSTLLDAIAHAAQVLNTHAEAIIAGLVVQGYAEEAQEVREALAQWSQAGDTFLRSSQRVG